MIYFCCASLPHVHLNVSSCLLFPRAPVPRKDLFLPPSWEYIQLWWSRNDGVHSSWRVWLEPLPSEQIRKQRQGQTWPLTFHSPWIIFTNQALLFYRFPRFQKQWPAGDRAFTSLAWADISHLSDTLPPLDPTAVQPFHKIKCTRYSFRSPQSPQYQCCLRVQSPKPPGDFLKLKNNKWHTSIMQWHHIMITVPKGRNGRKDWTVQGLNTAGQTHQTLQLFAQYQGSIIWAPMGLGTPPSSFLSEVYMASLLAGSTPCWQFHLE